MTGREHDTRLPVEPLDDAAWARIGAGIQAKLDAGLDTSTALEVVSLDAARQRRRAMWTASGALAVAAAAVLVAFVAREHSPQAATLEAREWVSLDVAETIAAGDARVALSAHSRVQVRGDEAHGYEVTLQQGGASFTVPEREARPAFVVHADDVDVEVVGTQFRVDKPEGGGVEVQVTKGVVRVTLAGTSQRVQAGQQWSRATRSVRAIEDEATSGRGNEANRRRRARATRREAAKRSTPAHAADDRSAPQQVDKPSQQERFEAAARLEASAPADALRRYEDLAQEQGPWAANALFAAARLQLENHRPEGARALLQQYLRRYPNGANAAAARALLEQRNP